MQASLLIFHLYVLPFILLVCNISIAMRHGILRVLLFQIDVFWPHVRASPTLSIPLLFSRNGSNNQPPSSALFYPGGAAATGFLWSSLGLAVLTAFLQGLVTALAYMTESSNQWTFRFRLAKIEHWWWTAVSGCLLISLVLIILSFASGNNNEAISILALSSTTFLTIVRYMLPSWRARHFIQNRWLAWAGPSRTAIPRTRIALCGNRSDWKKLSQKVVIGEGKVVPSDYYGWHFLPLDSILQDPTDILNAANSTQLAEGTLSGTIEFVYNDGDDNSENVSLLWGAENQGFQPRVSRSVSAVTSGLLKSQPFTNEGFAGEGFCLALGILGRNKGLRPRDIVFKMTSSISTGLEQKSAWRPRPAKTLRSYYNRSLDTQFSGLGRDFVSVAVELSLILTDADEPAVAAWLRAGCEHQSFKINKALQEAGATPAELNAHYESSYVSMVISLNNMADRQLGRKNHDRSQAKRPDILCLGMLLKARGVVEPPVWWHLPVFNAHRADERKHLDGEWYKAAAQLLGLSIYPDGFEHGFWNGTPKQLPPPSAEKNTDSN
jgi:hypothetical protein